MISQRILHLSHTDINYDSRILKEMNSLSACENNYSLHGIGVTMNEGNAASTQSRSLKIECINLKSRYLKFLPVFVRHLLSLIELTVKMFIKAIKVKPNIIHGHDTLVLPLGVVLKLITGSKLIYDAHELESNRNGLTPLFSKATLTVEKILWSFVDFLIIVSPSIQAWYQNNIGTKPSEVILNSPILNLAGERGGNFHKNYLRQKYGVLATEKIFIYVGIFGKGRGIERLIEVFSKLQKVHLVFVGYGELMEFITRKADIYSNIHLHDPVPHEAVVDISRSADVGLCMIGDVSLSDYYCLPNKLFEYCFAGIPVLASDFPDIVSVVRKYDLGICCGQDLESIKSAVKLFLENGFDKKVEIQKLTPLSWETQKDKLCEIYKNITKLD